MILEKLYKLIISEINKGIDDIDTIGEVVLEDNESLNTFQQISDQQIDEFIKSQEISENNKIIVFRVMQKIKALLLLASNNTDEDEEDSDSTYIKQKVKKLFTDFIEPDSVEVEDDKIKIIYDFKDNSKLKKEIDDLDSWDKDNVRDTLSKKLNIPIDNITFIDSVSSYVDFIGSFEEANYVSRGQKDCTYKLIPSLYRIYDTGYKNHSAQYESAFRQKVLYYDKSIESKDTEELRAYAQHFGLPTNYLDFTEAHLISLLFAVEDFEYKENHSIVYFVDALSYNREIIKDEIKLVDFSDKSLKETKENKFSDKSYFIRVGNSNERIHFQKGCFLKMDPTDSISNMFEKYTKIAVIDKDSKESILKELFRLGITFENIYPDEDNMVKTIRFIKEKMS